MDKNFENVMRDAQFRKGLSIAYFNSLNSAITLVTAPRVNNTTETAEETKKLLAYWRDYFLDEYAKFHSEKISNIGIEKIAPSVVEGLDKAKKTYENSKGSQSGNEGVVRG